MRISQGVSLLAIVLLGWLWLGQRDGRIRAEAQAAALTVRADSLAGLWRADSAGRARADSQHAAEDASRGAELARRIQSLAEARRKGDLNAYIPRG